MAYSKDHYVKVGNSTYYILPSGNAEAADKELRIGTNGEHLGLVSGQASGLNVCIGNAVYHAQNYTPYLIVNACTYTIHACYSVVYCVQTCLRLLTALKPRSDLTNGIVLSKVGSLTWTQSYYRYIAYPVCHCYYTFTTSMSIPSGGCAVTNVGNSCGVGTSGAHPIVNSVAAYIGSTYVGSWSIPLSTTCHGVCYASMEWALPTW